MMHPERQASAIREQRELDERSVQWQVEFHPHMYGASPVLRYALRRPRPRVPVTVSAVASLHASELRPAAFARNEASAAHSARARVPKPFVGRPAAVCDIHKYSRARAPRVEHVRRAVERALHRTLRRRRNCRQKQHNRSAHAFAALCIGAHGVLRVPSCNASAHVPRSQQRAVRPLAQPKYRNATRGRSGPSGGTQTPAEPS
jgi:hypothetical protein